MQTQNGRFTDGARSAAESPAIGVSRREGVIGVAMGLLQGACLAVLFQAPNMEWGGLVTAGVQILLLISIVVMATRAARVRRVHPRGHARASLVATAWLLAVVLGAGWFWIAGGPHGTSAVVTTLAAAVAVLPTVVVSARLIRAGT